MGGPANREATPSRNSAGRGVVTRTHVRPEVDFDHPISPFVGFEAYSAECASDIANRAVIWAYNQERSS